MRLFLHIAAITLLLPLSANARPVSYPGGWTVMTFNDVYSNKLHLHYSPSARHSIGVRHEHHRQSDTDTDSLTFNYLLKRWNGPGSQANLYFKSAAGVAYNNGDIRPSIEGTIAGDWETRRYYTSASSTFFNAGKLDSSVRHKARIGVAPYIGDYGDVHTWLMLEANYVPVLKDDKEFTLTPMVRFFKDTHMLEAGYNLDDGVMFNYVKRF